MRGYGIAIGYYIDCDSAICADCAPAGFAQGDYSAWSGFKGWESPAAIFIDSESDSPTHCAECKSLIPHDLTTDGFGYVQDAVAECITEQRPSDVVASWWAEYGRLFDESDLRDVIDSALDALNREH